MAGIAVEWISHPESTEQIIFYIHGGGYIAGSPRSLRGLIANIAKASKTKALAIDYSLAPGAPYPVALDEIEKVWLYLIEHLHYKPESIAILGESVGGNLALATVVRLRDKKLPLPGCLVLISPSVDADFKGESYTTHASRDPLLNKETAIFLRDSYLQGAPHDSPYVSPILADFKGMPPMLAHVGSEEVLFNDSRDVVQKAKAAGVDAELFVGESLWHIWHGFSFLPESKQAIRDIGRFIARHTTRAD